LVALSAVPLVWLGLTKNFAIDEFEYANAGWLLAQGHVAFRDFFEHHFPLHMWALGGLSTVIPSGPSGLLWLRMFSVAVLLGACVTAACLADRLKPGAAVPTFLLLVLSPCWVHWSIEIRPDTLALLLFCGSLALLSGTALGRVPGVGAGVLLGLAYLSSQKAVVYGGPTLIVLAMASLSKADGGALRRRALGAIAGCALVGFVTLGYLASTHSLFAAFHWCVEWVRDFEKHVSGFSPKVNLLPYLRAEGVFVAFGLAGWLSQLPKLRVRGLEPRGLARWSAVLSVPAALGSFFAQKAPYAYSLVPVVAGVGVFGGIFVVQLAERAQRGWRRAAFAATCVLLAGWTAFSQVPSLRRLFLKRNSAELSTLATLAQLTGPHDCVYDNSGSAFFRPDADFYFFNNWYLRSAREIGLARRIPKDIEEKACAVLIRDARTGMLSAPLKAYLAEHFLPIGGGLEVWGNRFDHPGEPTTFHAIRSGRYRAVGEGSLENVEVDGRLVALESLVLASGGHQLRFPGAEGPVTLVWAGADGVDRPVVSKREVFGSIF
jgi:hypothetical protein